MDPLDNLQDRVQAFLGQLGLDDAFVRDGVSVVEGDGVVVLITCFEQDGATWVRFVGPLFAEVEVTLGLLHTVLTRNHTVLIGAFQLFEDGVLAFSATLPGATADSEVFATTLRYVTAVAEQAIRELAAQAGGRPWMVAEEPS